MRKQLFTIALLAVSAGAWAQMSFSFSNLPGGTAQTAVQDDGVTLVQLPSGAELDKLGDYGLSAAVAGQSVPLADITPNPATTYITDGEIEVFTYQGKAYAFRFTRGKYFTCVMFSDPHIAQAASHDGTPVATMQTYVANMIAMGKAGGRRFSFDAVPHYLPTCDIVLCLGDMDTDSEPSGADFKSAVAGFNAAGIPFLTICGNHDLVPDYWTGDNPDKGLTSGTSGGSACNDVALKIVSDQRTEAARHGITDVHTFTDGTSHTQATPFTFVFRGVRFYMGQTYWFQKPYSGSFTTLLGAELSKATYYNADGVIAALNTFVEAHADEASVWAQHYPFVYGDGCDRWWLDENDTGMTIAPETASQYTSAQAKKDALAAIINKTRNPAHFSGHVHSQATNTYAGFKDYSVAAPGKTPGAAFIVLMKEGEGVVEVKQVQFN